MNKSRPRIVFLLPVPHQVRYRRRIAALTELGARSRVLAFERDYYPGTDDFEYEPLGYLAKGQYWRRVVPLIRAIPRVRRAVRGADIIYAFGMDQLLLGVISALTNRSKLRFIYEVGDIREVSIGKSLLSRGLRYVERLLVRRSKLVVITSQAYLSGYFDPYKIAGNTPFIIVENKLPANYVQRPDDLCHVKTSPLTIGYFGLIRCEKSFEVIAKLGKQVNGSIQVVLRGYVFNSQIDIDHVSRWPGVRFLGPYNSPDDLASMYSGIDLSWIAHSHARANFLWARANRFYEACFFGKPMIAQVGTEDGRVVQELDIGVCIDLNDPKASVRRLVEITDEEIDRWRANLRQLPESVYCYTNEHLRLYEKMWR